MTSLIKNLIIIVIGSVICIGLAVFGVRPMFNAAVSLNQQLIEKKNQVANLQTQITAYQTAKSDLAHASDKEKISDAFLIKENLVDEIKQMESAAGLTKTTEDLSINDPFVKKVDTGAPKTPPLVKNLTGITEVPYRITGLGDYGGITDFLSYLEHLSNFTEVSKIQLSAETGNSSSATKPAHTGRSMINIDGVFFVNTNGTSQN